MFESEKIVTKGPTNDLQPLHEKAAGVWGHSPHNLTSLTLRLSLTSQTAPGKPEVRLI